LGTRPASAPAAAVPQIFFLWAPLNFPDECLHYLVFQDENGQAWSETAAALPVVGVEDAVYGPDAVAAQRHLRDAGVRVDWAPGLRRSRGAVLSFDGGESVRLEPLLTFRMRGAGYFHPKWAHGRWHGGAKVAGEEHKVGELDSLAIDCIHVQQVMRATWRDKRGIGVLEQLAIGPHAPSGFRELLDGAV
jgi:hypothetical protein